MPSFGIARYLFMLIGVGVLPKWRSKGGGTSRMSVPVGAGKSAMASRTVYHFAGEGKKSPSPEKSNLL
jgi:hypothetical protein